MLVTEAKPTPPGFIDRVRDVLTGLFGWPGQRPRAGEMIPAQAAAPGRPADASQRRLAAA